MASPTRIISITLLWAFLFCNCALAQDNAATAYSVRSANYDALTGATYTEAYRYNYDFLIYQRLKDPALAGTPEMLLAEAEDGNQEAQYGVAYYYYMRGMFEEAMPWLEKAAENGVVDAYHKIITLYAFGSDKIIPDWNKAYPWLIKAAEAGVLRADFLLGSMYEYGLGGTSVDYTKAMEHYMKAAKQAYPEALNVVCEFYRLGAAGIEMNPDTRTLVNTEVQPAAIFALQGEPGAMAMIGLAYFESAPQNTIYWLERAANMGYAFVYGRLATMYLNRVPWWSDPTIKDVKRGAYWAQKAAESGDATMMVVLGEAYASGSFGFEKSFEKAEKHWKEASKLGYPPANWNLAHYFFNQKKDYQQAKYYAELALANEESLVDDHEIKAQMEEIVTKSQSYN